MHTLSDRVKYLIENMNLSVTAAANKCEVPQPRLNDIVLGKTVNPHTKTIQKLADGLETTTGWLLTGQGEMRAPPAYCEQNGVGHGVIGEDRKLTAEERRLVDAYQAICPNQRKIYLRIMEEQAKESREIVGGGLDSAGQGFV